MRRRRDRAKNLIPSLILRSPLHGLMSSKYLELTFTGVRSGRRYSTPVAYVSHGPVLLISTDSPWSRNIGSDTAVTLRWRNRARPATASVVTDPDRAARALRRLVDQVPGYAKAADLPKIDGTVTDAAVAAAVRGQRTVIEIIPNGAPG